MVSPQEPTNRRWWPFVLLALVIIRYVSGVTHEFELITHHTDGHEQIPHETSAAHEIVLVAATLMYTAPAEHNEKGGKEDPETEDGELRLIMRLHQDSGLPPQRDWQPVDSDAVLIGTAFQAVA